jgi:hypothetical protein
MSNLSQRYLLRAIAIALLATPLPAVAAPAPITLGGIDRTTLPGCDNPTPVQAPSGEVYSNVSDCSVGTSGRKMSTGWVKVDPTVGWVPSNFTAYGNGSSGRKFSGAAVDGGMLYRRLLDEGGHDAAPAGHQRRERAGGLHIPQALRTLEPPLLRYRQEPGRERSVLAALAGPASANRGRPVYVA